MEATPNIPDHAAVVTHAKSLAAADPATNKDTTAHGGPSHSVNDTTVKPAPSSAASKEGKEPAATKKSPPPSDADHQLAQDKQQIKCPNLDDLSPKLSLLYGAVNKMTSKQLKEALQKFKLDSEGKQEVLKKRVKSHLKTLKGESPEDLEHDASAKKSTTKYMHDKSKMPRFVAVVDFEATCEEDIQVFPNEIIEFPIVIIDTETREILDQFQSYCRPTINPRLSHFCKSFTGISQEDVDKAPEFKHVLKKARTWISSLPYLRQKDGTRIEPVFATDGPWDFRDFLRLQCHFSNIPYPKFARYWINVRKHFGNCYKLRGGVREMLRTQGMMFEGREHCGLDDSRNIARIALQLIRDGRPLTINESIDGNDTKHTRRFAPRRTRDGDRWQHLRIPRLQPPPHGKVSSDAQTAPQSDPIIATAAEASSSGAESVAQVATRSDSAVATTAVGSGSGAELDTQTAAQPDPAVVTPAVGSSNGAEVGTRNVTQDDTIASTAPASPNT